MTSLRETIGSLGFLGAGNMAGALIRGIIGRGILPTDCLWACDVIAEKTGALQREFGIHAVHDAASLVTHARTVVLAVKPQDLLAALDSLAAQVTPSHLLISIAAGTPLAKIAARLPQGTRLVRVMPNTPALVGQGAAGVSAGAHATRQDLEATLALFRAVGVAVEVREEDIDAVTALSGSGPAYVFRFIEILIEAGRELGLSPNVARELTVQTFVGAAQLAAQSPEEPAELRRRVTSKGGTTAAALAVFEEKDLAGILKAGVRRARDRSIELAQG